MCTKTDELYNASNNLSISNQRFSSTGGKLPLYGPRRVLVLARHAIDPFVIDRPRFTVTDEENRYFIALCQLAESSKWQRYFIFALLKLFDFVDFLLLMTASIYTTNLNQIKLHGFVLLISNVINCMVRFLVVNMYINVLFGL